MFHLRLLLFGCLQFLAIHSGFALDTPELRIVNAGLGKQIAVKVVGLPQDQTLLEVRTRGGRSLLRQVIHSTEYQALFSLEHLAEGRYVLVLSTPQQEIVQPIQLMKRAVSYNVAQRQLIFKPSITLSGRQLDIDFPNPSREPVLVSLQTSQGEVLHEQLITDRDEVELRMNLLRLSEGNYRVTVEAGQRSWSEPLGL
jgi:hypothetical protein